MNAISLRGTGREMAAWFLSPDGRVVAGLAILAFLGQILFAWLDTVWLGLPLVREEPARFGAYHLLQALFAMAVAAALVRAAVAGRAHASRLDAQSCSRGEIGAGFAGLAAGAAATILFLASPALFHAGAQEDRLLEWASALLLLAGSLLFVRLAWVGRGDLAQILVAAGLALALFVIGMEEISWAQRLLGFATPARLAELNWQAEFNLHNVQTDLSETLYYVGSAVFLLLLPLVRDLVPGRVAAHPLARFVPGRSVALVSAPLAFINFGHWNLFAIQLATMLALASCIVWARAAVRRGDRLEAVAFGAGAALIVVGQAAYLVYGARMIDLPDTTEYKELFIALGFAAYAATVRFRD